MNMGAPAGQYTGGAPANGNGVPAPVNPANGNGVYAGNGVGGPATPSAGAAGVAQYGQYDAATAQYGVGAQAAANKHIGSANINHKRTSSSNSQYYNQSYNAGIGGAGVAQDTTASYYAQPAQANALPLNQLYTCDLLRELPPSISDLSLPPPPIVLPANSKLVPNVGTENAAPEYFRSTLNVVPSNSALLKKSKLPFALIVRPYTALHQKDENVPITTDTEVCRCRRCRGYINPFVTTVENGARWRCNFCGLQNNVPKAFDYDENTNQPKNRWDRVELSNNVVDFVAPKEYMVRAPLPIIYTFVIDVSVDAIESGLTATITRTILETLDRIPDEQRTARVAFIAVDSNLHFFRFNEGLEGTEIMVVSAHDDPFLPCPDGFLVYLNENRASIEKLLVGFPSYFEGTSNSSFALGPALKTAHKVLSSTGGKIIVFGSTLPNVGIGKLSVRDEAAFSGRPKESQQLLNAADSFYKSFAVECNGSQVSVDMFLTSSTYQDVATLSNLPRYTAGQTHFYPAWTSAKTEDVTKLSREVSEHLSQEFATEAVLRVRASTGLRMTAYYGNFYNRSSDLCSFPSFPRDQSYTIEVSIEESIPKPVVYFQAAVLESAYGERRIRVMTLAIPTSPKLDDIYASADQLAIANYFTHRAIDKALRGTLQDARDYLTKCVVDILNVYKKELVAGNVSGASPLQISTNLRMLPLLLFALSKHLGFRAEKVPSDHRANALNLLGSIPIPQLVKYIYPTVYSLHNMPDECGFPTIITQVNEETGEEETVETDDTLLPEPINDSRASWENYGLYLIDTSSELFLWVSGDVVPGLVADLFGTENLYEIPTGKVELPEFSAEESEFNYRVRQIIAKLRQQKDSVVWKNIYIVLGGSSNEPIEISQQRDLIALRMWAHSCLVEDKTGNAPDYREFLTSLKNQVTQ